MWKRKLGFSLVIVLTGVMLFAFSGKTVAQEVSLGRGGRVHVKVDHQRVKFPHKAHQKMVLRIAGNDPEMACKMCHHKKRKGRDPRACRRCHAKRQVKAKGVNLCLNGCHTKRPELVEKLKELPRKGARKGQLLKLKDAFHLACKNCHSMFRAASLDLDSTMYLAPILNCEGCHQPVSAEDKKKVEEMRAKERKRAGDTLEDAIKYLTDK